MPREHGDEQQLEHRTFRGKPEHQVVRVRTRRRIWGIAGSRCPALPLSHLAHGHEQARAAQAQLGPDRVARGRRKHAEARRVGAVGDPVAWRGRTRGCSIVRRVNSLTHTTAAAWRRPRREAPRASRVPRTRCRVIASRGTVAARERRASQTARVRWPDRVRRTSRASRAPRAPAPHDARRGQPASSSHDRNGAAALNRAISDAGAYDAR